MSLESQNGLSHRRSRVAVGLATCAVAALSSGVVFAGSASATPTALADKFASTVTDDGWSLDLAATKLSANPVPNLATTAFTREGFVSAKVTGTIGGQGDSAVKTGYVEQGLQIGCQIDVSSGLGLGLGFFARPVCRCEYFGCPVGERGCECVGESEYSVDDCAGHDHDDSVGEEGSRVVEGVDHGRERAREG